MNKLFLLYVATTMGTALLGQDLRFAIGSCAELNDPKKEDIFAHITAKKPDFFLWLGDNTYYVKGEWNDSTAMMANWTRRHASPPLAQLLEQIPQRAIWDDHDFGPNDADSTYPLRFTSARIFASVFHQTPMDFPKHGDLRWHERRGRALLIGLDDRTHRGPIGTQVLGAGQLHWLSALINEHADAEVVFVAVGSQVLNLSESFENMIRYPEERTKLLDICANAKPQIVFLTGDRHHGELEELQHRGVRLIEVCSSPLTSKVFPPRSPETEENTTIVGAPINQEHFTILTLRKKRLFVEYFDHKGQTIVNVEYRL